MRRLFSLLSCRSLLLLAALAVALPVAAQDASSSTGSPVRGTVLNAVSDQPVARALVSLGEDLAMLTGSDGQFSFDNVPAGGYSVSVGKPGFLSIGQRPGGMHLALHGTERPTPPRHIQVGADMPSLTFRIRPLAAITGHITLSTSDPADGIQVEVFARNFDSGRPQWNTTTMVRTRSDGSFRVSGLAPGSYILATRASFDRPPSRSNTQAPVWGYPALYYPGVADAAAAGVLSLGAGQQAEADLTLVRQPFFPVAAVVNSESERPGNFEILDSSGRPSGLSASWHPRERLVHASVPNGTWTMVAHAYGREAGSGGVQYGAATFQVNSAPVAFAISLVPAPQIPVIIRRDFVTSTDPSQNTNSGPGVNIGIQSADSFRENSMSARSDSNSDNQMELTFNQPGRYWIVAQPFPPAYISSITSGGADLASTPLTVQPGSSASPIEITLRNDPGTITGQIVTPTENTPSSSTAGEQAQVWIYAIPLFPTTAHLSDIMPSDTGQFSFYNLAPGAYRVVACDAPQEIDFHSAEGLAAWAGKGQTVTVEAGGTASAELTVLHAGAGQ